MTRCRLPTPPAPQSTGRPQFVIIGAQRCGTTSLFSYLSQHPDIQLPPQKEIHYFDRHYAKGWAWYQSFFPQGDQSVASGEASPNYLLSAHAPARMKADLPSARLIVLLRNPVERAYSHYLAKRARGIEPIDSFERALALETQRTSSDAARAMADPTFYSAAVRHFSYVSRGLYFEQISRWLSVFSREQALFVKSEALFADPWRALRDIHEFIGVRDVRPRDLSPRNAGWPSGHLRPRISKEVAARLESVFRDDAKGLTDLLGSHFSWF